MKKTNRIISFFLTLILLISVFTPAIPAMAAAEDPAVSVVAESQNSIIVQEEPTIPTDPDFSGALVLTAGTYNIDRDYLQKCEVQVYNTTEKSIEYYLSVQNSYDDLYMNFVRNGSIDKPMVIEPGETQEIQLDIFAQNAVGGSYSLPVYALLVDGTTEKEIAKTTLTVYCDEVSLNLSCTEVSSSPYSLAKTMRLRNNGSALTDVTLSLSGDAEDYVQLNPIVSNYQMDRNATVEFKASPDLTKMKNNRVSVVSGEIIASAGGKSQHFPVVFDTQGQEITSTTMARLALKQSGNKYANIEIDKESVSIDGTVDKNSYNGHVEISYDMPYGELSNEKISTSITVESHPCSNDSEIKAEISQSTFDKGVYTIEFNAVVYQDELIEFFSSIEDGVHNKRFAPSKSSDTLTEGEKLAISLSIQTADAAGNFIPTELSLAMTAYEGVDLYGKYIAVNCTPYYSAEEKDRFNSYATAKSLLLAGDVLATAISVAFPGVGTLYGWLYGLSSTILGQLIDGELDDIMNHNSGISTSYKINGHQCTNAGMITSKFYLPDIEKTVPVSGVSISPSSLVLKKGESSSFSCTISPSNATNQSVTWSSSNPAVATVNNNGQVTAVSKGSATITAKSSNGKIDTATVTVKIPVEGVVINPPMVMTQVNDRINFSANIIPEDASNKNVTWGSTNSSVVTIDDNGCAIATGVGKANIYCTTEDGEFEAISGVFVNESDIKLVFEPSNIEMTTNQDVAIVTNVQSYEEFELYGITYKSEDPDVAVVDNGGLVSAKGVGRTTISVTASTNLGNVQGTVPVTVETAVNGIVLIATDMSLSKGENDKLNYLITPSNAGIQDVFWSSSDPDVVSVDDNGLVTAIKEGFATITVSTVDGSFSDSCSITVTDPQQPGRRSIPTRSVQEGEKTYPALYVTSRMYGGEGVNRWYQDSSTDYVDIADTTYTYSLNGKKIGTSFNSGVTDVAIAQIPIDTLHFGSNNTLICDYDTNPGHYFVNTDTNITIIYPSNAYVSYIGSPSELEDVRSLPDFAVYSENIFCDDPSIVVGDESSASVKVYNRGSFGGWFNIEVTCVDKTLYSEENHYLDAFSGDTISFKWVPENDEEAINVTLTNTCVNMDERDVDNNTASRTFKTRPRVVPSIASISPDYIREGDGILIGTINNPDDVTDIQFYIDGVLYEGEVKTSLIGDTMRCWINDAEFEKGTHEIKMVVSYTAGTNQTETIEETFMLSVLDKNWDEYKFVLDPAIRYPNFYLYDASAKTFSRIYNVTRSGANCTYKISKDIYDHPDNYFICAAANNSFMFKQMSTDSELVLSDCKRLIFTDNDDLTLNSVVIKSLNDMPSNISIGSNPELLFTPAKYELSVQFTYLGESRTVNLDIDLTENDQEIDLLKYVTKYVFKFIDEVNGTPTASLYYKSNGSNSWNSLTMLQSFEDDLLNCVVSSYNADLLNNAEEAFICVATNDAAFITDIKPIEKPFDDIISLNKSDLQKYTLSLNSESSTFGIDEVRVSCEKFSVSLYSATIYITPGEYDIVAIGKDKGQKQITAKSIIKNKKVLQSESADAELVELSIKWPSAYLENNAYVYGVGTAGKSFSRDHFASEESIALEKDIYSIRTNIVRNNSYYILSSLVDAQDQSVTINLGNEFSGVISNTFNTPVKPSSEIRMYLEDLLDKEGNELTYFNSQSSDDNLCGMITFTDTENSEKVYTEYVSLNRLSYIDVNAPDAPGTYSICVELSTDSSVYRPVQSIQLNNNEVVLQCNKTFELVATVMPENATNKDLIWISEDESIATVDENGVVKASFYKIGTTSITVISQDGEIRESCKIVVEYTRWQKVLRTIFGKTVFEALMKLLYKLSCFFLNIKEWRA